MKQNTAAPLRPRHCIPKCGTDTGQREGAAAVAARAHVKHCAAAGLKRLLIARGEAARFCGRSGHLQSWAGRKQKVIEAAASRFVASIARSCLEQVQVPSAKLGTASSQSAAVSFVEEPIPIQSTSPSFAREECREATSAQASQEQESRESALDAPSIEVREGYDVPQPIPVSRICKVAGCCIGALPRGEYNAVGDPRQLYETQSALKRLSNGVTTGFQRLCSGTTRKDAKRNSSTDQPSGLTPRVHEGKEKWMESYHRLKSCDYIFRYRQLFQEIGTLLSSSRLPRWQRDGLDFALTTTEREYKKALQELSSEIRRARSSVNLMRVQSCTNVGVNSISVLCNAGLISYLKSAWSSTVARLEDTQNEITESLKNSISRSLPKILKTKPASMSSSTC